MGTVCVGLGMVWKNPTSGLPMLNPTLECPPQLFEMIAQFCFDHLVKYLANFLALKKQFYKKGLATATETLQVDGENSDV